MVILGHNRVGWRRNTGTCLALVVVTLMQPMCLMAQQPAARSQTEAFKTQSDDKEALKAKPQFKLVVPRLKESVQVEPAIRAVAPAAVLAPVKTSSAPLATTALKRPLLSEKATVVNRLSASVLQKNGVEWHHPSEAISGLPPNLLNDRAKVVSMLGDLRQIDVLSKGPMTLFRRIMPNEAERDTQTAIDAVAVGERVAVTAGIDLFDIAARNFATLRCAQANIELDRHELNIRTAGLADPSVLPGSGEFWAFVGRSNAALLAQYRQAASDFTAACLDAELKTLNAKQRAALDVVLGHLFIDGVPSCMGTRIRADLFLTARHCFYQFDEALGWQPRPVNRAYMTLIGNPDNKFKIEVLRCAGAAADLACAELPIDPVAADHLVLRIIAPQNVVASRGLPPMPEMLFERPAAKQFLVVPGYSSWFTGRPWTSSDKPLATAPAVGGCVITEVSNGCVVNACQSDAGYSGSPMFARRDVDQLVMVGIFLGSATAYPTCIRSHRNFGATLPSYVAKTLAGTLTRGRQ